MPKEKTSFKETFESFLDHKENLKVVSVASATQDGKPNSAAKLLVDIVAPNIVLFIDYKFTQTYANIQSNSRLSVSFMDDDSFTGYKLKGTCHILESGPEYQESSKAWEKRLTRYEAERIIRRSKGLYSARESEHALPKDFVLVKFIASEAALIKPDRVLRAVEKE